MYNDSSEAGLAGFQAASMQENSGPSPRLVHLFPVYQPYARKAFRTYKLQKEDLELAFSEDGDQLWAQHRARKMELSCEPLERLVNSVMTTAEYPAVNLSENFRNEAATVGLCKTGQSGDILAIARFTRTLKLSKDAQGQTLTVVYGLDSLSVLPVHKNKGYERIIAVAVAGIIEAELECLCQAIWHTQALNIKPGFVSRLPKSAIANKLIAQRLNDDVIAQDSMLQLDGKVARFHPLKLGSL